VRGFIGPVLVTVAAILAACGEPTTTRGIDQVIPIPGNVNLPRNASLQLRMVVISESRDTVTGLAVTCRSVNARMATIDNFYVLHTYDLLGATRIACSAGTATGYVNVDVVGIPGRLTLTPADTSLRPHESVQYQATVYDTSGEVIPGAVTFSSSPAGILGEQGGGLFQAAGPLGKATVTASYQTSLGGYASASATVFVIDSNEVVRLALVGQPDGLAVSRGRVVYITRIQAVFLSRVNLPTPNFAAAPVVDPYITGVVFDTGGARAYLIQPAQHLIGVVDVTLNQLIDSIPVPGFLYSAAVAPDNASLWVPSDVDTLFGIDPTTKTIDLRVGFGVPPRFVTFPPAAGDSLLYVSLTDSGQVIELNRRTGARTRTFTVGGWPQQIVMSPDGTELYIANQATKEVQVWDPAAGISLGAVALPAVPSWIQATPDGSRIWAGQRSLGQIAVIDRATRTVLLTITTGGLPNAFGFDPGSPLAIVANDSGWVDFLRR
jgi:DNA-binding beta-propeller fold protein YncE